MARFADSADCVDPLVFVEEAQLEAADRTILALLRNKGVDPDEVTGDEGLGLLRDLAVAFASADAAAKSAHDGGESVLWAKQRWYTETATRLAQRVARESLGLAAAGSGASGFGSIGVGRG